MPRKSSKAYTAESVARALEKNGWRKQESTWKGEKDTAGSFTWWNRGSDRVILYEQDGAATLLKDVGGAQAMARLIARKPAPPATGDGPPELKSLLRI